MVKIKPRTISEERLSIRHSVQRLHRLYPNRSANKLAKELQINPRTALKWMNRNNTLDLPRRHYTKLSSPIKEYILRECPNKYAAAEGVSCRRMSRKILTEFNVKVEPSTVNNWLNDLIGHPVKPGKCFELTPEQKEARIKFGQFILREKYKGEELLFTDEKRYLIKVPLNKRTQQVRLDKEGRKQYKEGKGEIFEKVNKPMPKYTKGVMVAASMCSKGVGKLIFCIGTMDAEMYKRTIPFYADDIERMDKSLIFMQDNAPCHTASVCYDSIYEKIGKVIPWPANSPDLNPIETLWELVQDRLVGCHIETMEDLVENLQNIWNRIPQKVCENLVKEFIPKIKKVIVNGERVNRLDKKPNTQFWYTPWEIPWTNDKNLRIVYNNASLAFIKQKHLRLLKRKKKLLEKEQRNTMKHYSDAKEEAVSEKLGADYLFLFQEQKRMAEEKYNKALEKIEQRISDIEDQEDEDAFNSLRRKEKIQYLKISKKRRKASISTNVNSLAHIAIPKSNDED